MEGFSRANSLLLLTLRLRLGTIAPPLQCPIVLPIDTSSTSVLRRFPNHPSRRLAKTLAHPLISLDPRVSMQGTLLLTIPTLVTGATVLPAVVLPTIGWPARASF